MSPEDRMQVYALARQIDETREATVSEMADALVEWVSEDPIRFRALQHGLQMGGRRLFDRVLARAEEFATYAKAEPKPLTGKGSGKKRGPYKSRADKPLAIDTDATAAA